MSSIASFNKERIEIQVDDNENETWDSEGGLQWIGARNKYFLTAIIPSEQERRLKARLNGDRTSPDLLPNYKFEIGRQLSLAGSWKSTVYIGPLDYDILIQYGVGLEQAIDFGWPVIRSVTKFLLIAFKEALSIHTKLWVDHYPFCRGNQSHFLSLSKKTALNLCVKCRRFSPR